MFALLVHELKFDYGPRGDFFLRAAATEAGNFCYSKYHRVTIDSKISKILIQGDENLSTTHPISVGMGNYTEFTLEVKAGDAAYINQDVIVEYNILQRPAYLIDVADRTEYIEFVNNLQTMTNSEGTIGVK